MENKFEKIDIGTLVLSGLFALVTLKMFYDAIIRKINGVLFSEEFQQHMSKALGQEVSNDSNIMGIFVNSAQDMGLFGVTVTALMALFFCGIFITFIIVFIKQRKHKVENS